MRLRTIAVAWSVLVLAATAVAGAAGVPAKTKPLRLKERCLTRKDHATVVRFRTADGVRLLGVTMGNGSVGVALGHMAFEDLCNWVPFARVLKRHGYRALAFDFRNAGSSAHVRGSRALRWDRDFVAAVAVLRAKGAKRVVIAGASAGGTAALVAAPQITPAIDGVASLSGPANYNPLIADDAVPHLTVPVLYMATADDRDFASDAQKLYDETTETDKELRIIPGSTHGTKMLTGLAARNIVLGFIRADTAS